MEFDAEADIDRIALRSTQGDITKSTLVAGGAERDSIVLTGDAEPVPAGEYEIIALDVEDNVIATASETFTYQPDLSVTSIETGYHDEAIDQFDLSIAIKNTVSGPSYRSMRSCQSSFSIITSANRSAN